MEPAGGLMKRIVALAVVLLGLAGAFLVLRQEAEPVATGTEERPEIWSIDMRELQALKISLPRAALSESWTKGSDEQWYFDTPDAAPVDPGRWGGGIPLMLSGPQGDLVIGPEGADDPAVFGLDAPEMILKLTVRAGTEIGIDVGDPTPDGQAYYLRRQGMPEVYAIDRVWVDVLRRLVTEPPR